MKKQIKTQNNKTQLANLQKQLKKLKPKYKSTTTLEQATVLKLKVEGLQLILGSDDTALRAYIAKFKTSDNDTAKPSPPCHLHRELQLISTLTDAIAEYDTVTSGADFKRIDDKFTNAKRPVLALKSSTASATTELHRALAVRQAKAKKRAKAAQQTPESAVKRARREAGSAGTEDNNRSPVFRFGPEFGKDLPVAQFPLDPTTPCTLDATQPLLLPGSAFPTPTTDVVTKCLADWKTAFHMEQQKVKPQKRGQVVLTPGAAETEINAWLSELLIRFDRMDARAQVPDSVAVFAIAAKEEHCSEEIGHMPTARMHSGTRQVVMAALEDVRKQMPQEMRENQLSTAWNFFRNIPQATAKLMVDSGAVIWHGTIMPGDVLIVPAGYIVAEKTAESHCIGVKKVHLHKRDLATFERIEAFGGQMGFLPPKTKELLGAFRALPDVPSPAIGGLAVAEASRVPGKSVVEQEQQVKSDDVD